MCWNEQVSFATYLVVLVGVYLLWQRNHKRDRWFAVFLLVFGTVQLLETFIWLDQDCKKWNIPASKLLSLVLLLEPITLILASPLAGVDLFRFTPMFLLLVYLVVVFLPALSRMNEQNDQIFCTRPAPDSCHLYYRFSEEYAIDAYPAGPVWIGTLFLTFLLLVKPFKDAIFYTVLFAGGFLVSYLNNPNAYASLWCWLAVFWWLVIWVRD